MSDFVDIPAMARSMEREHARLWSLCYPRIYAEPRGNCWASPKMPSVLAWATAHAVGTGQAGRSQQFEFLVISHLLSHGMPIYWLTPDLGKALGHTKANLPIPWYTQKLPTEAGVLMLPRGLIERPGEDSVCFLAWARFEPGVQYSSPLRRLGTNRYEMVNGGMILLAVTEMSYCTHWNIPLDQSPELLDLSELGKFTSVEVHESGKHGRPLEAEDEALAHPAAHFVFMVAMALDDRPKLLTPATLQKRVCRKGAEPREFWSPNILGADYKVRTERPATQGEHRSPRFHLVRGFWREQAHGPARSLRTRRWIDPFWRGWTDE